MIVMKLSEKQHLELVTYLTGMVLETICKTDRSNGSLSINELRILNRIFMRDFVKQRPITISELSQDLEIHLSTVSKIVTRNIEVGVIKDEVDPSDARKRLLRFTREAVQSTREWGMQMHSARRKASLKSLPIFTDYDIEL